MPVPRASAESHLREDTAPPGHGLAMLRSPRVLRVLLSGCHLSHDGGSSEADGGGTVDVGTRDAAARVRDVDIFGPCAACAPCGSPQAAWVAWIRH
jgi:hypothetical protein